MKLSAALRSLMHALVLGWTDEKRLRRQRLIKLLVKAERRVARGAKLNGAARW